VEQIASGAKLRNEILAARATGRLVGLVPTMGALHEGHASLVRAARNECDVVVATIFVNPTQFGPQEDFTRYPRTIEADLAMLADAGADLVFTPPAEEIYPPGFSTYVEPPAVARPLEGEFRPGHFRGVCTVVLKLFQLAPADIAFFGKKDYQQLLVIRRMAADFDLPIEVRGLPTIRESDGLAMSSRNRYLSPHDRQRATAIYHALAECQAAYRAGEKDTAILQERIQSDLETSGFNPIDYVAVADRDTLTRGSQAGDNSIALVAARLGATRLIDNMELA
jgi:pantoate--beta-alanine ligase